MLNFYVLFAILVTLGLLKLSLSRSTFSTFLSVFLKCCLSFYVFETFLSFFPVVSYLLKDYSFVFLKTIFSDLKRFFPFGSGQPGKDSVLDGTHEQVLTMQEKESSLPQKSFVPSPFESPSNSMEKQGESLNSFTGKEGTYIWVPTPTQEEVTALVETIFVFILLGKFVAQGLIHLNNCRHTPEERKYARRNMIGMGLFVVLTVVLIKGVTRPVPMARST